MDNALTRDKHAQFSHNSKKDKNGLKVAVIPNSLRVAITLSVTSHQWYALE